ncbi:MAG: 4-amino-4-deoxychorismate lyase [Pseudonocardiales bacterium]|nr:4-amino-4-deoxychorismate lyase [Pseudonocardiales bacterium]
MPVRLVAVLGHGVVDPQTPVARADDAGLTRGDGCFEGIRILTGPDGTARISDLEAHLARMGRSAAALDIAFDAHTWGDFVTGAVANWHEPGETSLKLVLTRGGASGAPTGFLSISDLPADYARQRREGLRVVTLTRGLTSDAFVGAPWLLGEVKTLSYAVHMAAQREAGRRGCDDVIFVSADGMVLEAPTSTVLWSVGRRLHTTPTGASGILASTTQRLLFDRAAAEGWDCSSPPSTVDELHAADSVWLTASVRGPVDVVEIDGRSRERRPDVDAEIRRLAGFAI